MGFRVLGWVSKTRVSPSPNPKTLHAGLSHPYAQLAHTNLCEVLSEDGQEEEAKCVWACMGDFKVWGRPLKPIKTDAR